MTSTETPAIAAANRASWNAATLAHNSHKGDQAAFLRDGGSTLFAEEQQLLGSLQGMRLLHLQSNCGQDSLCLARSGAEVVGVDISDQAVDFARNLAARSGIAAAFHCEELLHWFAAEAEAEAYDLVYSGYGSLSWIADLQAWAGGIQASLKPGGALILADFHPLALMFDGLGNPSLPYSSQGCPRLLEQGVPDFVGQAGPGLSPSGFCEGIRSFQNPYPAYVFHWGLGEICAALLGAGLRLEHCAELSHSNGRPLLPDSQLDAARRYHAPDGLRHVPQTLTLRARR